MTVAEKLKSWLDEIGADGLMSPTDYGVPETAIVKLSDQQWRMVWLDLVPAYRHADGSYHTTKEIPIEDPCRSCAYDDDPFCGRPGGPCEAHKAWYKQRIDNKETK